MLFLNRQAILHALQGRGKADEYIINKPFAVGKV